MLTRIYIDNFRSFVNFEYRPERKQLLLGANGSGKSSLLDAIRYVQRFIGGDENLFTQSTRTRWQDKLLQVVEIDALLDGKKYEYRVEIGLSANLAPVNVERLKVSGEPAFELANGEIRFFPDNSEAKSIPYVTAKSALHLSYMSNSHVSRFVSWMNTVHCIRTGESYNLMNGSNDSEDQLNYAPEFISGWYSLMAGVYPEENVRFGESMKAALDGFQSLRLSPEDGGKKLHADFTTSTKKRASYTLSELSDGQRCLLALYMILHFLIARGHTVFIDEPDNFISLREIQPWLLEAETAVDDHNGQLILISHHPEILNQWASKYGLRFFREDNGHIRTEKFKADPDGNLQPSELIARGWEGE